jgi:ATP-dependent exoDNAse (exonuclease V) alpha subunit
MFIVNDAMKRFANGSIGRIIAYQGGYPVVELEKGDKIHAIPQEFKLKKGNKTLAKIEQIPLTLAWAITVHKSQGLTISSLEIDLSDVFTYGMGYVALSRGTHYKGINLVGYSPMALQVNPYTLKIDPYMLRASSNAVRGLDG